MRKTQLFLHKYINNQFEPGSVELVDDGEDTVLITDKTGETMILTLNDFYDVVDADTGQIYAISDLPHDIAAMENKFPTQWMEQPRFVKSEIIKDCKGFAVTDKYEHNDSDQIWTDELEI